MRLLFVSHSFPPPGQPLANVGGMQRVATELHAAFAARPDVALTSHILRTSWQMTHVRVVPFLLGQLWAIPRAARAEGVDAVLFSSMVTGALAPLLRRRLEPLGVPMAAIAHGRDLTLPVGLYQRLLPRVFDALDAVLPVSRATGAQALQRGLPPNKLHVLPNGIDVGRFSPPDDRQEARRRLVAQRPALPEDGLLLLSVGRHVERKGFAWFVDHALPRLPETIHYALAGEGPEADAIDAVARRRGLERRVHRLGRVSEHELALLYAGADLFLMPNVPVPGDMEGFGVVMLEAGLAGLPTVAADLEGIRDVVTEDVNGHLVPSGNAGAFASRIRTYADHPDALLAASEGTAEHVRQTFSWARVADQYAEVLRGLKGVAQT